MSAITDNSLNIQQKNSKTVKWLLMIVAFMFVFGFAQIQLYGLFCKAVGVNSLSARQKIDLPTMNQVSQTKSLSDINSSSIGLQQTVSNQNQITQNTLANSTGSDSVAGPARMVTVRFDATVNENLPWSFTPIDKKVLVQPGELKKISYMVKNLTNEVITGQSIANVTPWQAEPFLSKLECFCHIQQTLQPGEEKEMPLLFTLSEDLPENMNTLVVSYTFLNAEKQSAKKYQKHL